MNKWKNLKMKYREVLDANNKTGKEQRGSTSESFNKLFGCKASSKPLVHIPIAEKKVNCQVVVHTNFL
jgi:hypothetical protein